MFKSIITDNIQIFKQNSLGGVILSVQHDLNAGRAEQCLKPLHQLKVSYNVQLSH